MKKIAAILLSAVLACSFMAGCGDEDDSSSKKDKNDSSVSAVDESKGDGDGSKADESKSDAPSDAQGFEGKWECESMNMGGMTIEGEFFGIPIGVMMQIEIKAGGEGISYENDNGNTTEEKFTWKSDGSKITIAQEGEEIEFELKDGKLVASYTEEGQTVSVTLKSVDKFTEFTEEDASKLLGDFGGGEE